MEEEKKDSMYLGRKKKSAVKRCVLSGLSAEQCQREEEEEEEEEVWGRHKSMVMRRRRKKERKEAKNRFSM